MSRTHDLDETARALAKKVREVLAKDGIELDEKGDPRLSTPVGLEKDANQWESADGLTIPRHGSPARRRWNSAFLARVRQVFPVGQKTIRVPIADLDQRNPPLNGARYDLYHRMATQDKLPPIVVQRQNDGRWYVVDGNHRMNAARDAGLTHLEALEMKRGR